MDFFYVRQADDRFRAFCASGCCTNRSSFSFSALCLHLYVYMYLSILLLTNQWWPWRIQIWLVRDIAHLFTESRGTPSPSPSDSIESQDRCNNVNSAVVVNDDFRSIMRQHNGETKDHTNFCWCFSSTLNDLIMRWLGGFSFLFFCLLVFLMNNEKSVPKSGSRYGFCFSQQWLNYGRGEGGGDGER